MFLMLPMHLLLLVYADTQLYGWQVLSMAIDLVLAWMNYINFMLLFKPAIIG